ncbi:MAG: dTMP kinase [Chloroflexi bacterium]|nr:MAG: dTMP kinase [Chloroflexota bacterium]HEY71765.1 dTMP kinase [Thermoflexia bacterium]
MSGGVAVFITFEGPDGSGKTTQIRLLAEWLREQGHEVVLTREPGGTEIGDQIRTVLHDPYNTAMDARTEILLYSASRAQHVAQLIRPSLAAGKIIISDRYADSTLAYQGYGRGLDLEVLRAVTSFATGGLTPALTVYLNITPEEGLQRRRLGGDEWNRLDAEALEFHQRVRAGYLELVKQGTERWAVIDAARSVEEVQAEIRTVVQARLGKETRFLSLRL